MWDGRRKFLRDGVGGGFLERIQPAASVPPMTNSEIAPLDIASSLTVRASGSTGSRPDAVPGTGFAAAALGQDQQRRNHHQGVFHDHVQGERNPRDRGQRQQQDRIADEAAVQTGHAHRVDGPGRDAHAGETPRPEQARAEHRQRSEGIGEQIAAVERRSQPVLRQRGKQQRRQRQTDDELAQHAHVGPGEQIGARVAQPRKMTM